MHKSNELKVIVLDSGIDIEEIETLLSLKYTDILLLKFSP